MKQLMVDVKEPRITQKLQIVALANFFQYCHEEENASLFQETTIIIKTP